LGIGPNPQSPIPNPQSPKNKKIILNLIKRILKLIIYKFKLIKITIFKKNS